jgi:hypothetical protein
MDVTDVGYVVQPNAVNIGAAAGQRRLTLQHFHNDEVEVILTGLLPVLNAWLSGRGRKKKQ